MPLAESIKRFFEKTPWQIFVVAIGALGTAGGYIGHLLDANKAIASFLRDAITTEGVPPKATLKLWFLPIEFVIAGMAAGLLFLTILFVRRRYVLTDEKRAINEIMMAVAKIRDQAMAVDVPFALDSITLRYLVHKDLSAHHSRSIVIRAINDPILFWESKTNVSIEADPAEWFSSISFAVKDASAPTQNVVYLPTVNDDRTKRACLFFLPPIQPGQKRSFELSYSWPGLFNRLRSMPEQFTYSWQTKEVIPLFRLEIYLQEGSGKRLRCEISGPPHTNSSLTPGEHQDSLGWKGQGYIYEARDTPGTQAKFGVTAELVD